MNTKKSKAVSCFLALAAVIVLTVLDQLTKNLAVKYLMNKEPIVLWDGVFELKYLENRGAAFGLFQGQKIFFIVSTIVIVGLLACVYVKAPMIKRYHYLKILITICVAGAIGNFIDRMLHGYVVDFFYFKLINFPIFNVADIYVTCSVILFAILFLFYYKDEDDFKFLLPKKGYKHQGEQS